MKFCENRSRLSDGRQNGLKGDASNQPFSSLLDFENEPKRSQSAVLPRCYIERLSETTQTGGAFPVKQRVAIFNLRKMSGCALGCNFAVYWQGTCQPETIFDDGGDLICVGRFRS